MSSSNRRERELARQKRERQLAKAAGTKRRNQNLVFFLVGAAVLAIGGWVFIGGSQDSTPEASASPTNTWCGVAPQGKPSPAQYKDYKGVKLDGEYSWKLDTNCGEIEIELFADKAPETVKSFKYLSDRNFFDGTVCHRLTTTGLFVLQCGDPTGTGTGGPGYSIPDENLPEAVDLNYPAGTVAMANAGPGTGGSQFFIVYEDTTLGPNYTIFGRVTKGLDIVQRIAAEGDVTGTGDGAPRTTIGIRTANVFKAGKQQ